MFVVTLSKTSLKKLGAGAACCALVVFSAMLGRFISTRTVAVAAPVNRIESAQDIQTWFTGYGLEVDGASITADKVKIPRRWDDSFSAFNGVVQQSGMDLARYKGKTVEKWSALLPAASNGETSRYGVLLVYKKKAVGAYLLEKPSGTVLGLQDAQNELAKQTSGEDYSGDWGERHDEQLTDMRLCAFSKIKISWCIKCKIIHIRPLFYVLLFRRLLRASTTIRGLSDSCPE